MPGAWPRQTKRGDGRRRLGLRREAPRRGPLNRNGALPAAKTVNPAGAAKPNAGPAHLARGGQESRYGTPSLSTQNSATIGYDGSVWDLARHQLSLAPPGSSSRYTSPLPSGSAKKNMGG